MKLRQVPVPILTAICTLLRPYAPDVSETRLVDALAVYENEATPEVHPLLSKHEAGRLLGLSWWTVVRLVKSGKLPGCKIGGQWRVNGEAVRRMATTGAVQSD